VSDGESIVACIGNGGGRNREEEEEDKEGKRGAKE
jgi:hypothetical protein